MPWRLEAAHAATDRGAVTDGSTQMGRSGGFRVIILFRAAERAVFVYGFGKNERDNIREDELIAFRRLAALLLSYGDEEIATAIEAGELIEVTGGQAIS